MLPSHFFLLMKPFSLQPGVSLHLSSPSFLTGYKAAPPLGHVPGTPRALLPPSYQRSSLRALSGLLSCPHGSHFLDSSTWGWLSFNLCQGRAEVPGIKSQWTEWSYAPYCLHLNIRCDVKDAGTSLFLAIVTLHCREMFFSEARCSFMALVLVGRNCWKWLWQKCAGWRPFVLSSSQE